MSDCIRLAIIDDHPLFREGVAQTVRDASDMTVVGQGSSAQDAIRIVTTLATRHHYAIRQHAWRRD
jgi:two-component system, NarL family, nitrate/nitrite response regulator NarL